MNKYEVLGVVGEGKWFYILILAFACIVMILKLVYGHYVLCVSIVLVCKMRI